MATTDKDTIAQRMTAPEAYAQGWTDGYEAAIKDLFGTADPSVLLKGKT